MNYELRIVAEGRGFSPGGLTCGEDLFGANLRIHRIEAFRELVEMAGEDN